MTQNTGLGLCEHPGDGRPESEQPGRRQQDEPSFHRVHARSLSAYAHTSAPARAGSSHRFPNSRPETASCGNGGRADYRRIVGRPQCARPCGQPHSGPSHVTLPPPARGQVRRSGLGRLSPGPINFPKPRGFPAGLFFWVCSVAIVPGDNDHDHDRSGRVGAGCRQFCRMPRHGSLAMWDAWTTAIRPPSRRTAAAASRLIALVGPPISHWGMSRPLAPLSPGSGVFLFCVDQRMNGPTGTIALLVVGQAEGATLAA